MTLGTNPRRRRGRWFAPSNPSPRRTGALLSAELLFVCPIIALLLMAIFEFGLLWSANHQIKAASHAACRVGTMPATDFEEVKEAVEKMATRTLAKPKLIRACRLSFERGDFTGDPVIMEIRVPMEAAAPELLAMFGFRLKGRFLVGRTVMRRE